MSDGLWNLVAQLWADGGSVVVVLVFVCFIFWQMIWRVWSAAMRGKDEEISRLVAERDKYQSLVFERLLSSSVRSRGTSDEIASSSVEAEK